METQIERSTQAIVSHGTSRWEEHLHSSKWCTELAIKEKIHSSFCHHMCGMWCCLHTRVHDVRDNRTEKTLLTSSRMWKYHPQISVTILNWFVCYLDPQHLKKKQVTNFFPCAPLGRQERRDVSKIEVNSTKTRSLCVEMCLFFSQHYGERNYTPYTCLALQERTRCDQENDGNTRKIG